MGRRVVVVGQVIWIDRSEEGADVFDLAEGISPRHRFALSQDTAYSTRGITSSSQGNKHKSRDEILFLYRRPLSSYQSEPLLPLLNNHPTKLHVSCSARTYHPSPPPTASSPQEPHNIINPNHLSLLASRSDSSKQRISSSLTIPQHTNISLPYYPLVQSTSQLHQAPSSLPPSPKHPYISINSEDAPPDRINVPGPLTFLMIERVVSSMNSTRTCVTPPLDPMHQTVPKRQPRDPQRVKASI